MVSKCPLTYERSPVDPIGTTETTHTSRSGRPWTVAVVATLVLFLELGATLASLSGDPFAPVAGWGATRPADTLTFVLVVIGCSALYWCRTRPLAALATATTAYAAFMLLGHELGLFLAPMAALFAAAVLGSSRTGALLAGVAAYAASLFWVYERTSTVTDPGAALLAWVALGTVIGVFLVGPYVAGELVRLHRSLTAQPGPFPQQHASTTP